jgi:hypothetical protein
MRLNSVLVFLSILSGSLVSIAEPLDLETFESISASIKNKQNVVLQDESPLKVLSQYNQPQRKIQSTTEASESSLSTE